MDHRVDPIVEAYVADLANNNPNKIMVHYLHEDSNGISPVL